MCTVAPRVAYRHSIGEVWYTPEEWYRPSLIAEADRKENRVEVDVPLRPEGSGFQARLWENLYGNSMRGGNEQSRLEQDIYSRFEEGSTLRVVLKEAEALLPESEELEDEFDETSVPWDMANSAVLNKMYRRVQDMNKRNSFAQRKRRGSKILQSIFPLRKLSSQSIKKHIAKCSVPLFKLRHSDIKLQC